MCVGVGQYEGTDQRNTLYWEGRFIARQDNVEDKTATEVHDHNDKQSSFEYDDTQNCYKDGDWRKFLYILEVIDRNNRRLYQGRLNQQ